MTSAEAKVGTRVTTSGYPGTITRVCEWTTDLVEVRLASGTVSVDVCDCEPAGSRSDTALPPTRIAYFASWRCNCTALENAREAIPDLCPTHGHGLLGQRELVEVSTSITLGVIPDHRTRHDRR